MPVSTASSALRRGFACLVAWLLLVASAAVAQDVPTLVVEQEGSEEAIAELFSGLDPRQLETGLLHSRVPSLIDARDFDGSGTAAPATADTWRQLYHEFSRSALGPDAPSLPSLDALVDEAGAYREKGLTPLAVLSLRYDVFKPDALERGLVKTQGNHLITAAGADPYDTHEVFAAAVLAGRTYLFEEGRTVRFVVPEGFYVHNRANPAERFVIDFDDGAGPRAVRSGDVVPVTYATEGTKTIQVTAEAQGRARHALARLTVAAVAVPTPDAVWRDQTADRGYYGRDASYDAYIFYGDGNSRLTNPIVFVEGFDVYANDPVRRRTWQEMYETAAEGGVADALRARGFDIVLMKLHDAAGYIQRNAFALVHLLGRLQEEAPSAQMTVVGPSMGGVIARYALAYMERYGPQHQVGLYVSIDAPHQGANIPLGDQFFIYFYRNDSDLARAGMTALNSPAARQLLIYHYNIRHLRGPDPLRTTLLAELATLGYPQQPRKTAIADGSGYGNGQRGNGDVGFREMQPGDRIIHYSYRKRRWGLTYLSLRGHVWAVPNGGTRTRIFQGLKSSLFGLLGYSKLNVYISGTRPLDSAPGGRRATQADIANGNVPYGDVTTSFPDHAWIPTVSALDLPTADVFYNINQDANGYTRANAAAGKGTTTNFDAIYYPVENEEHVAARSDNVPFLLAQIGWPATTAALLPVDVTGLSAEASGDEIRLTWTASRTPLTTGFGVQRRPAEAIGAAWEDVGFVEARGTPDDTHTYHHRLADVAPGAYLFRLEHVDADGGVTHGPEVEVAVELAGAYHLSGTYPNPFNPRTQVTLTLAEEQPVRVEVYDAVGRRVAVLHEGVLASGASHLFRFEAGTLPSGLYLLRVAGTSFATTRTMTLLR